MLSRPRTVRRHGKGREAESPPDPPGHSAADRQHRPMDPRGELYLDAAMLLVSAVF